MDEARAAERYAICLQCEHLISFTKQCSLCLCFMNLKTKKAKAKCPAGKWSAMTGE